MKKVLICLLILASCGRKSDYETYKYKYDSTVDQLDTQVRMGKFYLQRGRDTGDTTFYYIADSCAIEAEKSLMRADSFQKKMDGYEIHSKLGDSSNNVVNPTTN